jgi:hypothetical protein
MLVETFVHDDRYPAIDHDSLYEAVMVLMISVGIHRGRQMRDLSLRLACDRAEISGGDSHVHASLRKHLDACCGSSISIGDLPWLTERHLAVASLMYDRVWLENDWYRSVDTVRGLSPLLALYKAWREYGSALGVPSDRIDQLLPKLEDKPTVDPLASLGEIKLAIVSPFHEREAKRAGEEISRRTRSTVVVASEPKPGSETRNAVGSDVVLFTYTHCKHSHYRLFDGHRQGLVYVNGYSWSAIVSALEIAVTTGRLSTNDGRQYE